MKYVFVSMSFVVIYCMSLATWSDAYDEPTHEAIAFRAIEVSSLKAYLSSHLGFAKGIDEPILNRTVRRRIADGALLEDSPVTRVVYHFHNPLQPWNQAGLTVGGQLGQSSVLWNQQPNQSSFAGSGSGSWSWFNARQQFLDALTKELKADREKSFADLFRSLGQGTHLIQDATVPAHVRNDQHLNREIAVPGLDPIVLGDPDGYEKWAKNNLSAAQLRINQAPIAPPTSIFTPTNDNQAPSPIARLFDTDRFQGGNPSVLSDPALGIAEFTNGNFLSKDTIFRDFALPQPSDLDLANPVVEPVDIRFARYYSKSIGPGETIPHFVREGMLWRSIQTATLAPPPSSGWVLDDKVHRDYAASLFPRAVGYSAALIDYFFRGRLKGVLQRVEGPLPDPLPSGDRVPIPYFDFPLPYTMELKITNESEQETMEGDFRLYVERLDGTSTQLGEWTGVTLAPGASETFSVTVEEKFGVVNQFFVVFEGRLGLPRPHRGYQESTSLNTRFYLIPNFFLDKCFGLCEKGTFSSGQFLFFQRSGETEVSCLGRDRG